MKSSLKFSTIILVSGLYLHASDPAKDTKGHLSPRALQTRLATLSLAATAGSTSDAAPSSPREISFDFLFVPTSHHARKESSTPTPPSSLTGSQDMSSMAPILSLSGSARPTAPSLAPVSIDDIALDVPRGTLTYNALTPPSRVGKAFNFSALPMKVTTPKGGE